MQLHVAFVWLIVSVNSVNKLVFRKWLFRNRYMEIQTRQQVFLIVLWTLLKQTLEVSNNFKITKISLTNEKGGRNRLGGNFENRNYYSNDSIYHHRIKRNVLRSLISKLKRKKIVNGRRGSKHSTAEWVYPPEYGVVPQNAFVAGLDVFGEPVFVGRGRVPGPPPGALLPGRLRGRGVCVEVAWRGWGRCLGDYYQVLVGNNYRWKPGHRDWFPHRNVIGGTQPDPGEGGSQLYICRYYLRDENNTDQLTIGKVTKSGKCWTGYMGHEMIYYSVYEILVFK